MSVESVRKRLAAATPGPWTWGNSGVTALDNEYVFWPGNIPGGLEDDDPASLHVGACGEHTEPQAEANLALLAHAHTDLALALEVIEAAQGYRIGSSLRRQEQWQRLVNALDAFEAAP